MCIGMRYTEAVIVSFRHKGLEAFFVTGSKKGIQADHAARLGRILGALDVATTPKELDLPGYRLYELAGRDAGTWSVRVNGNWRVTFKFVGTDVELVDYRDYR
jgi:toxin HigB-1